jgi:hypothetical protein
MRKELDLFANVRPVTEYPNRALTGFSSGKTPNLYALGPYGIDVDEDFPLTLNL